MGFYIRKAVSVGPFRFNLSKSGVGLSVGVKGFRVGSGPRGNYVHMGRYGLYYRASLDGPRYRAASEPSAPQSGPTEPNGGLTPLESGNVLEMVPAAGSDIVEQINKKMALWSWWPWVLGGGLVASAYVASLSDGQPFALALAMITFAASAFFAHRDVQRKAVVVMYDLDDDTIQVFKFFSEEFDKVGLAQRIRHIDTMDRTSDWKRNAGATRLITSKDIHLSYSAPRVVKTNIAVPAIIGGRQNVYFFPDVALVTQGSSAGAIPYNDLRLSWSTEKFIEEGGVPSDAQVIGYTWRFVNKKGGPDRRFNNNRQLPEVLYQDMDIQGPGNLRKVLQISQVADRNGFNNALNRLREHINKLQHPIALGARS